MANPNIVDVTSILGNNSSVTLTTTSDPFATALVSNPASSGEIYKINSMYVSNISGSSTASITIKLFTEDDLGGTGTEIASSLAVPAGTSLVVIDKNSSIYLVENQSLGATANSANALVVTTSWEEIS